MQVLQAYYGVEDERVWELATGLGAGISRRGFICGALTGGTLACGMATARGKMGWRNDVRGLREPTYSSVQRLTGLFEERFGTVECREMTGCDFLTAEGQAKFKETMGMERICKPAVRMVVEAVAGICP